MSLKLLKSLLSKEVYEKYQHNLSDSLFSQDANVKSLFSTIKKIYTTVNTDLTVDSLRELHYTYNPTLTLSNKNILDALFVDLQKLDISKEVSEVVVKSAIEQALWTELANLAILGGDGQPVDLVRSQEIIDTIREGVKLNSNIVEVSDNIDDLLSADFDTSKWKFTLKPLRRRVEGVGPNTFTLISARTNVGKCLGKDTPILMYDGSTKVVQNVVIGDVLMGPDSKPRNVLSTCVGKERLYKISYPWGENYVVNESHILSLKWGRSGVIKKYGDVLNISVADYLKLSEYEKRMLKGWKSPVHFSSTPNLDIPPYILGVWLGDGHADGPYFTNTDTEILSEIASYCATLGLSFKQSASDKITYGLIGYKGRSNEFTQRLKKYNLLNNKHIPDDFKFSSMSDRLALLAGLLDTDGYLKNGMFFISQKRQALAEDIVYLARSVGLHATVDKVYKSATNGSFGNIGEYYSVTISGNIHTIPTKCLRKVAIKTNSKRKNLHFGIAVTPMGVGDYYGFTLDSDHLFLLGDFTVTHNTGFVTSLIFQPASLNNEVGGFVHQGAKILYVGNEESVRRTKLRAMSCLSGYTKEVLEKDLTKRKEAQEQFNKIKQNITCLDAVGYSIEELTNYLKENKGYDIVVVDILDKLSISGKMDNEVERLYKLYVAYRELGKRFNLAVIGTCQASIDADNKEVFGTEALVGSKTGKGGELDLCLCLGRRLQEDGTDNSIRTINIAKNKLNSIDGTVTFMMDKDLCRVVA